MRQPKFSKVSAGSLQFDGLAVSLDDRLSTSERLTTIQSQRPLNVFYHRNRDGSIAVAVGREPDIWPEDEPREPDIQYQLGNR